MQADYQALYKNLAEKSKAHADASGAHLLQRQDEAVGMLLLWLDHLCATEATGTADILLVGVRAAAVEVAGCLSLGLVRPALLALRAEIDMILSWLYFKDHGVEWEQVEEVGQGFKLKSEVIEYCEKQNVRFPRFNTRYKLLEQRKRRREKDPYRLLSAHLHSQVSKTFPAPTLEGLINPRGLCEECIEVQQEVVEYLNDVLFSCFAEKWTILPPPIMRSVLARLNEDQRRAFFFDKK